MNLLIRFVVALIAFVAVIKFVSPILLPIYPPLGALVLVVILVAIIWWFLTGTAV